MVGRPAGHAARLATRDARGSGLRFGRAPASGHVAWVRPMVEQGPGRVGATLPGRTRAAGLCGRRHVWLARSLQNRSTYARRDFSVSGLDSETVRSSAVTSELATSRFALPGLRLGAAARTWFGRSWQIEGGHCATGSALSCCGHGATCRRWGSPRSSRCV